MKKNVQLQIQHIKEHAIDVAVMAIIHQNVMLLDILKVISYKTETFLFWKKEKRK
jgi:hypothetical protein